MNTTIREMEETLINPLVTFRLQIEINPLSIKVLEKEVQLSAVLRSHFKDRPVIDQLPWNYGETMVVLSGEVTYDPKRLRAVAGALLTMIEQVAPHLSLRVVVTFENPKTEELHVFDTDAWNEDNQIPTF